MKDKKGFTLIELLAIIVILAIIAVITVPIILNIIENSKKGAASDSAYGFKAAVNDAYISKLSVNSDYVIPDETYTVEELKTEIGLSLSGKEPLSNSWVTIEKNNVIEGCLQYDEFKVEFTDGKVTNTEKGECAGVDVSAIVASLNGVLKSDGATYISDDAGIEIYYNPVSGARDCNGQEGCMHWYLYSIKGNYANMMLDHNITDARSLSGLWAQETDYTDEKSVSAGITYPGIDTIPSYGTSSGQSTNARGPVTALNTLKALTSGWIKTRTPKVPNSTSTNEYIVSSSQNDNKYQINYTGYKARLITKEEAEYLGCGYCVTDSCPSWMKKSTLGENSTTYANIYGYWTSSPIASNSLNAEIVYYDRNLNYTDAYITYYGVRPVITVRITDVLTEPLS